jgi:hypothetical protein
MNRNKLEYFNESMRLSLTTVGGILLAKGVLTSELNFQVVGIVFITAAFAWLHSSKR